MNREALTNNEQLFRTLIEQSTDTIFLIGTDGTILYGNPSFAQESGYETPDNLIGLNAFHLIHINDIPPTLTAISTLLASPNTSGFISVTFRLKQRRQNSWHWMEGTLRNCLGIPAIGALLGTFHPSTNQQQRAGWPEECYQDIFAQAPDALFLISQQGQYLDANTEACALSGYTREELRELHITDLAPSVNQAMIDAALVQLSRGETIQKRWQLKRKDQSILPIELQIRLLAHGELLGSVRDLSPVLQKEHEYNEQLLQERAAHNRLYQLFMQAPANIAIMQGPQHRFELANPRFLQTVGRIDVLGKPIREALPEIAAQGYEQILDRVYSTGTPFVGQEAAIQIDRRGDGVLEEGFFNFVYQPFYNAQGKIEGVMVHGVEVTEQVHVHRKVEELVTQLRTEREALQQAQQKADQHACELSAIFETITDGLIVCDRQGNIRHTNAATRALYDNTHEPAYNLFSIEEMLPERLLPHTLDGTLLPFDQWPLFRVLKGERLSGSNTADVLIYTRRGEPLYSNVSGAPIFDAQGTINGAVVVLRDVTQQRYLIQKLEYSERKLRSLVEANILGVAVVNIQGRILEVNNILAHMLGYSRDELLDEHFHWQTLTPPELRSAEAHVVAQLVADGTIQPRTRAYRRKNGKRFPALIAATMIDQEQQHALVVVLDISDRQAAEQRKQEFLSMISHELRTPLTGIVGFLDLALFSMRQFAATASAEQAELLNSVTWMLQQAEQQTSIETRLVDALLDVSRMERHVFKLALEPCNLIELVREVTTAQRQLANTQRIQLALPEQQSLPVIVDADRIKQVIVNYLTNALKYGDPEQDIIIGLEEVDQMPRVFVRNYGPALTEQQQQLVWECFYQATPTHNEGGGLGLGLYIAKVLVEQHYGQVGVSSQPGEGTTFWFTLPIVS